MSGSILIVEKAGGEGVFTTIQGAVERAQAGDTIMVKPGIYREHVALVRGGMPGAPLRIEAEVKGSVFVRGSEVWNPGWESEGRLAGVYSAALPWELFTSASNPFHCKLCVWSHNKWEESRPSDKSKLFPYSTDYPAVDAAFRRVVPPGYELPPPAAPPRDRFSEPWPAAHDRVLNDATKLLPYSLGQLFYDGRELVQSQNLSEVHRVPGSWILSLAGARIIIHFPPGGEPDDGKLEITVRDRVFAPARRGLEHVVVSGFVFEHCGNQGPFPQNGMVSIRSGSHWVFEHNVVRHAKTVGLDCGNEYWKADQIDYTIKEDQRHIEPHDVIVRHNLFCDNGLAGLSAHMNHDFKIVANIFERNNALSLSNAYECEWEEQGAIKLHGAHRTLIAGNVVRDNCGHGIWIDNGHTESRITRNFVHGNQGSGIYIEAGRPHTGGVIDHNIVSASGHFFNFRGAGIMINDSSDLLVAHNLVVENFGPGLAMAAAKGRFYEKMVPVCSSRNRILNNIFMTNHGNVEMPFPHEDAKENRSDGNLYVNAGSFRFWGSRVTLAEIVAEVRERVGSAGGVKMVERGGEEGNFARMVWSEMTGWEARSLFLTSAEVTCFIKPYEMSVRLRIGSVARLPEAGCERVAELESDYSGVELREGKVLPGPFQNLQAGDNYYLLLPMA